ICGEHGRPLATVGCPGGDDQGQADLQMILNMLVFGMNPQQAVEAPRFATETLVDYIRPLGARPCSLGSCSGENFTGTGYKDRLRCALLRDSQKNCPVPSLGL